MTWHCVNSTFYLEAGSGLIFQSVISKSFGIVAHNFQGRYAITNSIFLDTDVIWIWYFNCTGSSHLYINNSKFLHGRNGLTLSIGCSHVHVTITNSVFSFNQAYNINIYLAHFLGNYIEMSNVTISNSQIGLAIDASAHCSPDQPHYLLEMSNMTIARSSWWALEISDASENCAVRYIMVRDSIITENLLTS